MSEISNNSATNPVSTGGGGTFFEQHVDALFLALLLMRAPLPILKDCQVEEVHLQTENLGWHTDDVLVVAARPDGMVRRLVMQVKRQFTISTKNETCKKAFGDFWVDFKGARFDPMNDRFALVTLRGTNVLLEGFNSLLDCARASSDAEDFMRRIEVEEFLSNTARGYATTIRKILEDANNAGLTDEEFWHFLSILHIVSFDLNTASAQTETWIKALLAASVNEGDALVVADVSWRELLELVGVGMPTAASYRYTDFPHGLRNRHGQIDTRSTRIIRVLSEHSAVTLGGIKTTIGPTAEITRDALTSQVLEAVSENQVVLISAPAGLGKSAVAKRCMQLLGENIYCIAFRAEEFSVSHIDQTLQQAQIPANGTELLAILSGQGRKLVLVEGIERLLESSMRDAFADLLNLAHSDRSFGLMLTCRDYSLETVTSALLGHTGFNFKVVEVPPLSDEELDQAVTAVPTLANALKHENLKNLLRSPYILDKAAQMDWSRTEEFPTSEREFRRRCWGEVIRRNAAAADGMPQRREHVFEEVALRRARQLRPFVAIDDLDQSALDTLRNDGLIVTSPEASSIAAPGHDVLEDWAIIQWLGQRWVLHERAAELLAEDVGGYPAVRRAYRKWLLELLIAQKDAATDFVLFVFRNRVLPAYFRDDTLVCTLKSPSAREFFERHRKTLFEDDGQLLIRVIHLMRVACKAAPWWLRDAYQVPSQLLVASGDAWPAVLEIVLSGLDNLIPEHTPTLLGLIEDFASSTDWRKPEPKGFEQAAKIGFKLLRHFDGYRMDDLRKRTLKVIAKMPRGDANAFKELVEHAITIDKHRDQFSKDVSQILLGDIDGWMACWYFPEEIIRLTKSRFLLLEDDLDTDDWRCGDSIGVEPFFGIKEHTHFDSFPASAIRGVFLPLLRHHPQRAIDFIIELFNHAGSWYGEQRWPYDRLEPACKLTIEVPGEASVTQWASPRLWNLYRGHSVGPYVLQTALMALEVWLLEICKLDGVDVESWLLKILRESNNIMATAVVASICNASPEKAGRAALSLLSSQELISMDRARMVQERGNSCMSGIFPSFGINQIYEDERKKSDALPHRGYDLEAMAVRLQTTEHREEVFTVIDRHRAALPPIEEQTEEHRVWRLALHRMDVRGYYAVKEPMSEGTDEGTSDRQEPRERRILLGLGEIEADVQEVIDRHAPIAAQQERDLSLLNWGRLAWEGQESSNLDIRDWEPFLARARVRDVEPEPEDYMRGGPGMIAAVCARDHWDEMNPEDRDWCIGKLVREIERECDSKDEMIRHSRSSLQPDRRAAYILPCLINCDLTELQDGRIKEGIAKALTHASEEVVIYAAEGVGAYSTGKLRIFSESCIGAIAAGARLFSDRLSKESIKPYQDQVHASEIQREVVLAVRTALISQCIDSETELCKLDLDDWPGRQAAGRVLQILGYQPDTDMAIRLHRLVASWIVDQWDQELSAGSRRGKRHFEFEQESLQRLSSFVLKLGEDQAHHVYEPFLYAIVRHPKEVTDFIRDLVVEENRNSGESPFWAIWQAFADEICIAPWIDRLDSHYSSGKELIGALFFGNYWKENVRHWHKLEGQAHRVDKLATQLLGSETVFDAYCRYLHDIGESSLPKGFIILANSLNEGDHIEMLAEKNTVFMIESLLRRYVYSEPYRLKSDSAVRNAVLEILDNLVEAGSSAAYRMRDDFVTPLSGNVGR